MNLLAEMKPNIAITVDVQHDPENERSRGSLKLNFNYAEQVALAGGNPILISPWTDLSSIRHFIHGWLIPGGEDMDASHFGEENHPEASLQDPLRWELEETVWNSLEPETPIFGICYGCQLMNVRRGGSLIQHLPDVVGHDEHRGGTLQQYSAEPDSYLVKIVGNPNISGKSYHHQAIQRVGEGLRVTAHAEDGTVEAIEDPNLPFFVGVQWHPERTPDAESTQALFREFVRKANEFRLRKETA